jgi:hypothetical protein
MTVHVFFTYPETAGKSLEEIDWLFEGEGRVKPWRSGSVGGFGEKVQERERRRSEGVLGPRDEDEKTLQGDVAGVNHKEDNVGV